MKKLFFAAAAAAMVMGVSCTETTSNDGNASITVKISGPSSATRIADEAATEVVPVIDPDGTHYVYVLEGNAVVHKEPLTALESGEQQTLADGEKIFKPGSKVYILANIPENTTGGDPAAYASMGAIEAAISAISFSAGHNADYETPAMGNSTGAAATIGTANDDGLATVAISLTPLFTRVELQGIKGGEWIKSFTVKNVYLDNYYPSFSMTGVGSGLQSLGEAASVPSGWFGDEMSANNTWEAGDTDPVTAGAGQVWAYHVGAGSLVRVLIELENVIRFEAEVGDPTTPSANPESNPVAGPTFVTVTGYTQTLTSFARGNIYSIKPITFNQVGPPNDDMVAIRADVTIKKWELNTLDPIAQ